MDEYDVIVIGTGPAGETAAGRCADGGLSVAVVERELVGGECSYWACIPSKVLVRPGDVLAASRRVPGAAPAVTGGVDAAGTFAERDRMASNWDDTEAVPWLDDHGVTLIRGVGRLAGERAVEVTDTAGTVSRLQATRAVIVATGTTAAMPPISGLAESHPWDNRDITGAKDVPNRLLVLGGGAVGLEMAQAYRRLGSAVTIVEALERLLAREEPFAGEQIRSALDSAGIVVHTGVRAASVRRDADGELTLTADDGSELVADELLVATGRRPATADLGLEHVGLEPGRPIDVDDQLRARGVDGGWLYAVGDCNGRALLTHMGKYQARVAGDVILGKHVSAFADHVAVPRVTFTDPQIAAVGLTEQDAQAGGRRIRTLQYETGAVAGASVLGGSFPGTSQLVIDEDRDIVIGATFVGHGVQELLHSATIAIAAEVPIDRLWHAVPSFPTVSEVWLRLLEADGR